MKSLSPVLQVNIAVQLLKHHSGIRLILAVALPILAAAIQWVLWPSISPLTWLLFYPAVIISAWLGGFLGGVIATLIALAFGVYGFTPIPHSCNIADFRSVYSAFVFALTGVMVSYVCGLLHRACAVIRDTDLKQAEESSRVSEAYYRVIFSANPVPMYILDYETLKFVDVNNAALLKYGYTREEFMSLNIMDIRPDTEQERALAAINAAIAEFDRPTEWGDWLHRKKDGSLFWMHINTHALALNGRPVLIVLANEVTEQKQAEQLLQETEARWQFALEGSDLGVWDWDIPTGKVYYSKHWKTMLGYAEDDIIGRYEEWVERLFPDDLEKTLNIVHQHLRGETEYYQNEYLLRNSLNEYQWILARGMVISRDADGKPLRMIGTHLDMTENHRLLDSLRDSENLTRSIMNSLDSSIAVLDERGDIVHINQAVQDVDVIAASVQEPWQRQRVGQNYFEMCRNSTQENAAAQILQGLQAVLSGEQKRFSQEFLFSIGTVQRWFRLDALPLQGAFKGLVTHLIDVTERKKIEDTLREQGRLLAESQAIAQIGNWMVDMQTMQSSWSDETFRLYGLSPTTQTPPDFEHYGELVYPDDRAAVQAWGEALLSGGEPLSVEFRTLPINGQYRWLKAFGAIENGSNNRPLRMLGTVQDISASKQMAAELQRWADAFRYCAHGIAISNPNTGRILACNPGFARMLGYARPEELEDKLVLSLYPIECHDQVKQYFNAADQVENIRYESLYKRRNDTVFDVQVDLVTVKDDNNQRLYRVATAQNISQRKRNDAELLSYREHLEQLVEERTQELTLAREEAERLSQIKTTFLANMSHEIRSPMNAVLGFCYLLEQQALDTEARQLVDKIDRAGHSLLAIINDILDFSKIEAGRLDIEHTPFRLGDILDDLAAFMSISAKDKPLELSIIPVANVDDLIGDGSRLKQVLVNLLSNAIKFTEQGVIELRVSVDSEDQQYINLRFAVRDTGIGISPEKQTEIFSAFSQADSSISRRFGGTGLGLSISQELVKRMGGTLLVESSVGQGSQFWFAITLEKNLILPAPSLTIQLPQKVSEHKRISGVRVLVVDDSEINREVAQQILVADGASVCFAADGQEALDWLFAHPDSIDIILMDIQMPRMDGYTATRHIREDVRWQKLPIIALTAGAFDSFRDTANAAGMDDFVAKPFNVEELMAVIQRFTASRQQNLDTSLMPPNNLSSEVALVLSGIDMEKGLKQWRDKTLYFTYLDKFASDYSDAGHTISQYLARGDFAAAAALAHKIKGLAGTLALPFVTANVHELDEYLKSGTALAIEADTLQQAIDEVCLSLSQLKTGKATGLKTHKAGSSGEALALLDQLLLALGQDNPSIAEPLLLTLQEKIASDKLAQIQAELVGFDFRAAERSTQTLIAQLKSS